MSSRSFGAIFAVVILLTLTSIGFATVRWSGVGKSSVTVSYVDPFSGQRVDKKFTHSTTISTDIEILRDVSNSYHMVHVSMEKDPLVIDTAMLGVGTTSGSNTLANLSYDSGCESPCAYPTTMKFNDNVFMTYTSTFGQVNNVNASTAELRYVINGDTLGTLSATMTMTLAGTLSLNGQDVPAKVTILTGAQRLTPAAADKFPFLSRPLPPPLINQPTADSFKVADQPFGAVATVDFNPHITFTGGDPIDIAILTQPTKGTLSAVDKATLKATYTPTPTKPFEGDDTFTYKVNDTNDCSPFSSGPATVTITYLANKPPKALSPTIDALVGAETPPIIMSQLATDPEGQTITITATSTPPQGTATIAVGGTSINYKSGADATGTDTFTYTVEDSLHAQATGTVTVNLNHNPVANPDGPITVAQNSTNVTLSVLVNDTDEGVTDPPNITIISPLSLPSQPHGTATIATDSKSILYTPTAGYIGSDTLNYSIQDGHGGVSNQTTVSINVQ